MPSSDSTSSQFRQVSAFQDESFSAEQAPNYQLLLNLTKSTLLMAVTDLGRNKVLVLEEYDLGRNYSDLQTAEQIKLVIGQHKLLLKNNWAQVRCAVHQSAYTLLPASLFNEQDKAAYFRLAGNFDPAHEQLHSYTHPSLDLVVLFSVSNFLVEQLNRLHSKTKLKLVHGASAFIEGIVHSQPRTTAPQAFLLIEPQHATITLLRDGAIIFCNTFYFTTPEDFIYYVVLVLQEHQLNPETDPVMVWGELLPDSALFAILQKYVRNVSLGKRPASLSFSYRLPDIFPHRYFDLYSLSLCN